MNRRTVPSVQAHLPPDDLPGCVDGGPRGRLWYPAENQQVLMENLGLI